MVKKKEVAAVAFDPKDNMFIVYIVFFTNFNNVYFSCRVEIAPLKTNKTLITILPEYPDFIDNFS